jgi:fumarylacetoacetate (FAA) hydrolase family protein
MDFPVGVALLTGTSVVPGPEVSLIDGDFVSVSIAPFGTLENVIEVVGSDGT